MKKNAMLKIAAILMVAVLLTTCAISSTFAKYTSTKTASASARVAEWGIVVNTSLDGIFAKEYANTTNTSPNVKSLTADMVVAPGTNESINLNSTVSGQPEVSVTVTNAVTFTFSDGWTYDSNEYMPIVFTINGEEYAMDPGEAKRNADIENYYTSISALVTAINAAASTSQTYAAGFDFDAEGAQSHDTSIAWAWDYEASATNQYINDAADTHLGNTMPTITITVVTTVTQTGTAGDALETAAPAPAPQG